MLLIHKTGEKRLDIELSGVLDADMMALGLDDLIDKAAGISGGVMLYKIPSFSMPTGGAMAAEMMRLPQLFQVIGHFKRCAVMTDIAWLRGAAAVEGALMPGLEIKAFGMDEEAAAEDWLAGEDDDFEDNMPV